MKICFVDTNKLEYSFEDINNQGANPFEDWYVHPELVNMEYITKLIDRNRQFYKYDKNTGLSINYQDIQY